MKYCLEILQASTPQNTILRSVCFHAAGALRHLPGNRRVGKPRQEWLINYGEIAFRKLFPTLTPPADPHYLFQILQGEVIKKAAWESKLDIGVPTQRRRNPQRARQRGFH